MSYTSIPRPIRVRWLTLTVWERPWYGSLGTKDFVAGRTEGRRLLTQARPNPYADLMRL